MRSCQYKNINLNFTDTGKGHAVVLLHGFLENLSMWNAYSAHLSKKYRVVCVDLLGHGATENLGYLHTMEDMAEAVLAVLHHLKLRKYSVIGHSMGGYVALALGERIPDNIAGLGLFFSTSLPDSPEKKEQRLRGIELVKQNQDKFVSGTIPALFRPKSRELFKTAVQALIDDAKTMSKQGIIAAISGMRIRPDREALLHFGPYKMLIICGKRDAAIPFETMQNQLKAQNVVHTLVTENGHMGHIEDAEICLEAIEKFLKLVK